MDQEADQEADQEVIEVSAWNHVGIRVAERARSLSFYGRLGFREVAYFEGPRVAILRNAAGMELNLIVNGLSGGENVLMDRPEKHPGYTHASLRVASMDSTVEALGRLGIPISDGPVELGGILIAVFVRDPDGNVVELAQVLDAPPPAGSAA